MISMGNRSKNKNVDVFSIDKSLDSVESIEPEVVNDAVPCCRWANSATFIPPIRCILFFGGFDSRCNFNDAALFSIDDRRWHSLRFDAEIGFRAYHSTCCRMAADG